MSQMLFLFLLLLQIKAALFFGFFLCAAELSALRFLLFVLSGECAL